jgi:beta-1,4-mannosyl-glycoprotein beta-1,4-N-acetylglucosaminyltransferase
MKIFDCFMYNNEELILNLRLNYLEKKIEKFIIVESEFDHQGNKKKLNFDINKFSQYKNKIEHLVVRGFPENMDNWERENFQRNYLIKGLSEATDEDYILISDVDEIPNISNLGNIEKHRYTAFKQKNLFYKFNLINKTIPDWYGSKICKKKYLKSPQWLRKQKVKKFSMFKFFKIRWNIIENGGWHFSYLMEPKMIQEKLQSFAHAEYNSDYYTNLERIKAVINQKKDLFDRNQEYLKINLDDTFPKYITQNKKEFKKWII